ncbi:MAG TPA: sigma-70 family RNA polymerase sigma factor [Chthoniobacteraceae bacterium]|nr:sigma-70 family RNA polymerase sigma factor [Chthoniobacteraceae bacterium]
MHELDDTGLLREYVERDSEEAFAALVARHVNKVYSVALRHTGNQHQAEEITQAVFVILARKSRRLSRRAVLYSWLYKTARLVSLAFIRGEIRRTRREQEACMQTIVNEKESDAWTQIAPLLDAALAGLNETDRRAIVLRFFYGKSMRETGADLGANEDAARKRVNRALEKLRKYFTNRGVSSTPEIIAGAISANSVQAAPEALANSATAAALAKGGTASTSTLTLIKGALKLMAWTKTKITIVAGVAVILAAGAVVTLMVPFQKRQNQNGAGGTIANSGNNETSTQDARVGYVAVDTGQVNSAGASMPRAQSAAPSDTFIQAYLSVMEAQKLDGDGKSTLALEKYRYAAGLLQQIRDKSPDWQPVIVAYRLKKTNEAMADLEKKMSVMSPSGGADF